ncbi:unnamed protein product [Schistosoma margrebowiei]|uniref:Fibronectin type-III domain-containing protein n=1 Tax=Schistosoma margrebowiei TaxID=48269 RepID=A0AA84ZSL3_9TREM|nr:unnamed protein product [Schistosoma margrebowiei]
MPIKSKNLSEKADDGYSLLSYFKVLPGYSDNRRLKATWDWSSMEVAQNLLQQAKILYYNDLDVDLLGQEIIQDYQIKEFDLTNLHPDTKYLICFRVTRKRFVSSSLSSSPSLYIQSNGTIATLTPTFKSSIHHQNKTNNVNNISDNLKYQQKINNPIISYKNISFLNRSYRQQSSLINSKFNNEYVAEMKCQITFTRFLHWTAILCSLIGIVIALLLSIMIFSILKSRAYKLKQSERKMYFNQKGELLLIGHKKVGNIHGDNDDNDDDDEEENNLLNSNKLPHICHYSHSHDHHHHHHHHHYYQHHHHPYPHSHSHHQHHHHHHHHLPHEHVQNQHIHCHCRSNSSKKTSIRKQEPCNYNKIISSSPLSLSTCYKSSSSPTTTTSDKLGKMKDKNIKLNIPSEVKEDNEMNISKQQLEDWENTLKNIETDNTIIIEKDNMLNSITKPVTYSNKTEITNDINCSNNNDNESTMNNIKIQKTSETILPNLIMESKRTVSFKDETTTTTTSSTTNTTTIITTTNNIANTSTLNNNIDSNNDSNNINDGIRLNSVLQNNNSIQLTSLDSHNDELNNNDFIKPISISLTESSLIHFRHHIPEYTQMDNNNNRLQSNNSSSYFEIKSPLLKEFEQKSCTSMHPVDNENENNNNTTDDNPKINDNRMIEIVTNKLNTNEVTVQLPISPNNSPTNTIRKNSTVSIPDNDALLIDISTSDNDGKNFIANDKNWFITSSGSTSNVLVDKNEQKSIFCTQLIETL